MEDYISELTNLDNGTMMAIEQEKKKKQEHD